MTFSKFFFCPSQPLLWNVGGRTRGFGRSWHRRCLSVGVQPKIQEDTHYFTAFLVFRYTVQFIIEKTVLSAW